MEKQETEALLASALFKGITKEELPGALQCLGAAEKHFTPGAYLLEAGSPATHIGVVLSGAASVVREDEDGNRTVQALLQPGDLFAETFAAARLAAIPVAVVAEGACTALFWPYQRLVAPGAKRCAHHDTLVQNLLGVLAAKNLLLNQRLGHLAARSLRQKLLLYLRSQAKQAGERQFAIPLDRQALADYLCADRSAVSAELGRMRRDGLVDYRKNQFTLHE